MTNIPQADNAGYAVDFSKLKSYSYEIGPIRPPSEGGSLSLLLRVTENCPWSRCTFCYGRFYNREKFRLRPVDEVKADIDTVKAISDEIKTLSWKLGFAGRIELLGSVLQGVLLSEKDARSPGESELNNIQCVINVYNWLVSGGRTVFLQDADTMIMPADQLVEIIRYLKTLFPDIERITSYARSKSIYRKTLEELKSLHEAGLSRLHVGLETGDDELLKIIDKGVTAEEHIIAGKKALEAGFELSEYVMPGLGGRKMWVQHAENTARVLNEINPDFIRMRPFVPSANTPLLESYLNGEFEMTSPHERLREIKLMIENLQVTSGVCFDHALNTSYRSGNMVVPLMKQDYNGYKFPEGKGTVLELIDNALELDEKIFIDLRDSVGIATM